MKSRHLIFAAFAILLGWSLLLFFGLSFPMLSAQGPDSTAKSVLATARVDQLGDALPSGALLRLGTTRLTHQGSVSCVAYSPDGKFIASGGYDGAVRVWDAKTGKEVRHFQQFRWVRAVAWSPTGTEVLYASDNDGIRVVSVASGQLVRFFELPEEVVSTLAVSPDGKTLAASLSGAHCVRLLNIEDGKLLNEFNVTRSYRMAFSPDSRLLAVGGGDEKGIRVWEVASGTERPPLIGSFESTYPVAFSPDGKTLVAGGAKVDGHLKGSVTSWDVATGKELSHKSDLGWGISALAFSPSGKTLAFHANGESSICLWDMETDKKFRELATFSDSLSQISFSPDGKCLAAASERERGVRIWDVNTGEVVSAVPRHYAEVADVAFSPDGKEVATACEDRRIIVWNAATGEKLRELLGHGNKVTCIAYSADGKVLASGSNDRTARIWDAKTGKELCTLQGNRFGMICIAFSPDGKSLASGEGMSELGKSGGRYPDAAILIWDVATGKAMLELNAKAGRVAAVAFSPDGHLLASASPDENQVHLWDAKTGKRLNTFEFQPDPGTPPGWTEGIVQLEFCPDGKSILGLASYSHPGNMYQINPPQPPDYRMVRIWDAAAGTQLSEVRAQKNEITAATFTGAGKQLLVGRDDGSLTLWDIARRKQIASIEGHHDRLTGLKTRHSGEYWDTTPAISKIALSRDGKKFATSSFDTTALLWDASVLAR